jgi:hypothetical protein
MEKHQELKSTELEVGMKVAIPQYVAMAWQMYYDHPIWNYHTISKLTPKKTKAWIDERETGTSFKRQSYDGSYKTGMYRIDDTMDAETEQAEQFVKCQRLVGRLSSDRIRSRGSRAIAHLGTEDLVRLESMICDVLTLMGEKVEE